MVVKARAVARLDEAVRYHDDESQHVRRPGPEAPGEETRWLDAGLRLGSGRAFADPGTVEAPSGRDRGRP